MTIAAGILFILTLYKSLTPATKEVPGPPVYGALPVPTGTFSLSFRKLGGTSMATYWAAFEFVMNSTESYRLTGSWMASGPTWAGLGQLFWFEDGLPLFCPLLGCPPPWTWPHYGHLDEDFIQWTGCGYDDGVLVPTKPYDETRVVFFVSAEPDIVAVTQPVCLQEIPTTRQCPLTLTQP